MTIGLDVGDRKTHYCVVNPNREVQSRGAFSTNPDKLSRELSAYPGARIVLEAGSQSPWMFRQLIREGFDTHVVDARLVQLITKDPRKNDRRDAEMLARLDIGMPELLGNIHHRSEQAQADLSIVRARDVLVRTRGSIVNQIRSLSKAFGVRLPSTSTSAFAKRVRTVVPEVLLPAIEPLLDTLTDLTARIRQYERLLEEVASERYPQAARLQVINGVGPITAMAFVLSVEDPGRFQDSRRVGSWLGLCPRKHASGDSDPELRITKAGNTYLRRLLVQCAHYILGPHGKDCDLRRFGDRLARRGGRSAKKRAAAAVARKLAVLLHRLWRDGLVYDPLHHANRVAAA